MFKGKKHISVVMAACIALTATGINPLTAHAVQTVVISPDDPYAINNGVFEGWGTSLCWWANRVGYSDSLAQQCADTFFGENGLRLNIARFNIGGGDDPTHNHINRTDSNMPGYTKFQNGQVTYDWTADANQRNVLKRCVEAAGDDAIVEMFSNSPPYWMCKSGCSTGNRDAGQNNLKDDCYDDFAEYLAEVCKHYQEDWGIRVQSVEAMNEPYTNYWGAFSPKQEGCHFDTGRSESTVITELQKSMAKRGHEARAIDGMIQVSDDGENWKTVYTITGEPSYGMHYVTPQDAASGRYVRYTVPSGAPTNGINRDNAYCCNIAEIELYGKPHSEEPVKLKGDANANGTVEISDAVMLAKYLLTAGDVTDPEAADMNADGILNAADMTLLKHCILQSIGIG